MSFEDFRDIMNDALARRCAFGQLRAQALTRRNRFNPEIKW
jgi:hypothetical protein